MVHDDTDSGSASEDDSLPEPLPPLDQPGSTSDANLGILGPDRDQGTSSDGPGRQHAEHNQWWQSRPNKFLLWRRSYGSQPPASDPERNVTTEDLDDSVGSIALIGPDEHEACQSSISDDSDRRALGPFPNLSSFLFAEWWWNGQNEKSGKELERLLALGRRGDFSFDDVLSTNWKAALKTLDSDDGNSDGDPWYDDANWISTPITIPVSFHRQMKNSGIENREVGVFQHRRIMSVIEEKIRNLPPAAAFHYQPCEVFWSPSINDSEPQHFRVQGELYNSAAFVKAHQALQDSPPIVGCNLERVVIALMFWSDETHLSAFGSAKVWPCYMFFGNESKYRRSRTSLKLCEHIAYFDSLSDDFKDYLRHRNGGKTTPKDLLSHCSKEMFHAQWNILLGDKGLLDAMKYGVVLASSDGVQRRFFPTVFTYSADYPEKTRIALIKQNGLLPCPTCLIPKNEVHNMGTPQDMTFRSEHPRVDDKKNRDMISKALRAVKDGYAITGNVVEKPLKSRSLLPIRNAFSTHLGQFGFNIYQSLVVDLLHEFEIGVWKRLYIHLLRLLEAFGKQDLISELDERYRQIPSFGRDTIRKFSKNASECKRRAARDYEDLLQCSIASFEGLLPSPHNENVMDLLFLLCEWHALAKLRMHHDLTLEMLDKATVQLASQFRKFQQETCQRVVTVELQREVQARVRKAASKVGTSSDFMATPLRPEQDPISMATTVVTSAGGLSDGGVPLPGGAPSAPLSSRSGAIETALPRSDGVHSQALPSIPDRSPIGVTTVVAPSGLSDSGAAPLPDGAPSALPSSGSGTVETPLPSAATRREKKFSLSTPKYHALGHYADAIRTYGTTDSFTSEIGETNHPIIKTWYKRTDRRNYPAQFAKISRRQARFRRMRSRLSTESSGGSDDLDASCSPDDMDVPGFNAPTRAQYHIGESKTFQDLNAMFSNSGILFDPVVTMFIPQLKRFLLPRIQHLLAPHLYARVPTTNSGAPQPGGDWAGVVAYNNRIYSHQTMQVKYTTYDVRREADIIRLKAEPNVMVLADRREEHASASSAPPYRYARVLGIFHTNVMFVGDLCDGTRDYTPHRVDFLWVRWYTSCGFPSTPGLEKLHFEPLTSSESIGFLDPRQVLRAVHLTPQFSAGKQGGPKLSKWLGKQPIWNFYYINRFVDRDMYMRYHWGLAVGHAGVQRRYQRSSNSTSNVHRPEKRPGTESLFPSLEELEPTGLPESDDSGTDDDDGFDACGGYDSRSDGEND